MYRCMYICMRIFVHGPIVYVHTYIDVYMYLYICSYRFMEILAYIFWLKSLGTLCLSSPKQWVSVLGRVFVSP